MTDSLIRVSNATCGSHACHSWDKSGIDRQIGSQKVRVREIFLFRLVGKGLENPADDGRIRNAGDDLDGAAAMLSDGDVDFEYANQSLGPRHSDMARRLLPCCLSVTGTAAAFATSTRPLSCWRRRPRTIYWAAAWPRPRTRRSTCRRIGGAPSGEILLAPSHRAS
jgi:hypothetical protein